PRYPHIKVIQMSNNAASKLERGTKRTCQNSECGSKFYDLILVANPLFAIDEIGMGPLDPAPRSPMIAHRETRSRPSVETPLALKKHPLYSQFSCPRTTCIASCVRYWSTQGRRGSQSCVCLSRPGAQAATPARPGAT